MGHERTGRPARGAGGQRQHDREITIAGHVRDLAGGLVPAGIDGERRQVRAHGLVGLDHDARALEGRGDRRLLGGSPAHVDRHDGGAERSHRIVHQKVSGRVAQTKADVIPDADARSRKMRGKGRHAAMRVAVGQSVAIDIDGGMVRSAVGVSGDDRSEIHRRSVSQGLAGMHVSEGGQA